MKYLLNVIDAQNTFTNNLAGILSKYPNVDANALGMKRDWQHEPLWQ